MPTYKFKIYYLELIVYIYSDATGNLDIQSYTGTSNIKFCGGSTAYYQTTSSGGANVSDRQFKENIINVNNAFDKIENLQGVYFNMIGSDKRRLGLIADETKQVIPQVVVVSDGVNFLRYDKLVALLIECVN